MALRCRDFLSTYGTGDPAVGEEALAAHLQACPSCRDTVAALEQVKTALKAPLPRLDALDDRVHDQIMAGLRPRQPASPARVPRWAFAAASAALLVLGIAVGRYFMEGGGPAVEQAAAVTPSPQGTPIEIKLFMPEGERIAQNPSRVRFVVKGLGVAEERGEIRLDEPVLDMVDPMVRPASFTGF